jgi:general secretion pathway protein D
MTLTLRAALIALLVVPGTARALHAQQPPVRTTPSGVVLNFQDVDLAYVISALAQAAGLNVAYTDLPQKNVTLRTSQPVSPDEVAAMIRTLAESNGVSVTQENGFLRLQGRPDQEEQEPRQLYIHRLRHARAPVLANTLQALFGGGTVQPNLPRAPTTLSQQLRQMEQQSAQIRAGGQIITPPVIFNARGDAELVGDITIVPDELTNALLVRATAADWLILQQAIQALDLRPLQVVIEVVIAEVQRTDELDIGVSFSATDDGGEGRSTTGSLPGTDRDDDFRLRFVRTGNVDVEATLAALSATGNVRILSRPVVLAQNNQEASILVGSERPFVQVSRSLPTDEVVRDEIVQYRDVGTSLYILPTINDEGYVNLLVTQQVSAATNEIQFGAPVISTREATTQILARNGQTVVVGGLVDRQQERVRSGIPLLKDIPVLGYLFGTTRDTDINSELFLFLTPYIVATDEDADQLREEIEGNVELLQGIVPITPLLPRVIRPTPPDTGAIRLPPPDTGAIRR